MSDINPVVLSLAEILKKSAKLDPETGVIVADEGAFEKTLEGTDLTMDLYKQIAAHNANIAAATGHVTADVGLAAMKADKTLNKVSFELPILQDSVSHTFTREKEVLGGAPGSTDRETKKVYGQLSSRWSVYASGPRGQLKKVKAHFAALAEEALG